MPNINNRTNEFQESIPRELFDAIPKTVWSAIAISALTVGGDYIDEAEDRVLAEWSCLADNGVVPPLPRAYRK